MTGVVAVRLPNWLGDTVMAEPALRALRAGLRHARIVAVGPWASLLTGGDVVDVLVEYPRAWSDRLRRADDVRRLAPAVAVLLPNSFEAAASAWYWGARRRVGYAANGRRALLTDAVPTPEPRRHQIDEYLEVAELAGGVIDGDAPRLARPTADSAERGEARALLAGTHAAPGARVGVHLGAAYGSSKLWPVLRVAEFCRIAAANGLVPVLLGAPSDVATADAVRALVPVASVVGRDRPALLPALLAELDVVVSGDTGVAHLATALGTPVLVLFGPTDPRLSAPRGNATVLTNPVPCAPCFYRVCPIDHPCLEGVEPPRVLQAVRGVVDARARGRDDRA